MGLTSRHQYVIGVITRVSEDAVYMLTVMAGRSENNSRTQNISLDPITDFTSFCNTMDLIGMSIGVPTICTLGGFESA